MAIEYEISGIKQRYREIFLAAADTLFERLDTLRDSYSCVVCDPHKKNPPELLITNHEGCGYRIWQQAAIAVIENDIARDLLTKLNLIEGYKAQFKCHMCGVCCRFASSEFSYEQLEAKAAAGDNFARQFTSIFLPYPSQRSALEQFPAIVESVLTQADDPDSVYFYHCPYIGEDNRCTIYGDPRRPQICDNYPDTPLTFIYNKCAWKPWKDETHEDALWAHSMIELCTDTANKLKDALSTPV